MRKTAKKLLSDWFHDHKEDLKIEMKPSDAESITVYGEPDPILQAFTGTDRNPIIATGPIFSGVASGEVITYRLPSPDRLD